MSSRTVKQMHCVSSTTLMQDLGLDMVKQFEGSQEFSWPPKCHFLHFGKVLILARHFQRKGRKYLAKINYLLECGNWHFGAKKVFGCFQSVSPK